MGKLTIRFLAVLLAFSLTLASFSGMTAGAADVTETESIVETEEIVPEGSAEDESQDIEESSEAEESASATESSEAEENPGEEGSSESEESSGEEESSESEERSGEEESSEAEESTGVEEVSKTEESSSAEESSEAEEGNSDPDLAEGGDAQAQELSDVARTYIGLVGGMTEAISAESYQAFMERLGQGYEAYNALTENDKAHPQVVSANQVWNYLLKQSQVQEPALITDTHWNLLTDNGYPDPYEQGGIYIHSLAAVGSGFKAETVESSDQTGWYLATNRSKDASVYMDWSNGAYMGETWYDVRVYYWCPDGDYYVSRSANMTVASSNLSERRIFLEFHFFQSGKVGQWAYEVSDFYGVMGSRDLDYVADGNYYEGWAFPVNQDDNNSSVIGNVYTSSDTVMEIQWSRFSITNSTHKNGSQSSSTYYFLPYFATQKDSTYGWDDYACLFWTFHSKKSDPMVLCHYTAGPLQAGLNGDPIVVRYYLTGDSALPAGTGTAVPKSIFTTYGAKFKRFEDATVYKGYNFTGWSINKNLAQTTEYVNSSTTAWMKQSSSTIYYLTSAGDYRIGEHNSSGAYTLYGADANWYGLKLADGLTHGTYEWDQDCTVTYRNNGSTVSVGLSPNDANYGTIRRVLLFGKYVPWTGSVQVIKTSAADSSVKVPGAVYGLYSDASCTKLLASATTNSSGVAKFSYTITYGTAYYVKEMESPNGWLLNQTVYTVKATDLQADKGTVTVNASDEPSTYVITTEVVNGTIDPKITGIPKGGSRTINTSPNIGYVLESVTIDGASVDLSQVTYRSMPYAYTFTNITANHHIKVVYAQVDGSVTFVKTDSAGAALGGVEIALCSTCPKDGAETFSYGGQTYYVMQTGYTGDDGKVVFGGLDTVNGYAYLLSETSTVSGQMLLAEPVFIGAFPVKDGNNADSYDYEVTAVNSRNYVLPMTGEEGDFTLCTWSAAMLSVIICLMIMKKEKEITK